MTVALERSLQRGWLLYQEDRFDLALAEALAALGEDPRNARAHALAGWCHLQLGRLEEGEASAREAIGCAPNLTLGWSCLCDALFLQQAEIAALEAADRAVELDPDDADLHWLRARCLHNQGQRSQALEALARALELEPEHRKAHETRARVLEELQRDDHASVSTDTLLRLEAESAEGHALRGWLALRRRDLDAAEGAFLESLRIDPNGDHARDGLAALCKMRHPLLRWLGPGWRGPAEVQAPKGEAAKAKDGKDQKSIQSLLVLFAMGGVYAFKQLFAGWGMWPWLAWPLGMVAAALAAFLAAVFVMIVKELSSTVWSTIASLAHRFFVETLSDLVLAFTRRGRHALPPGRAKLALLVWGSIAFSACAVLACVRYEWFAAARVVAAALVLLPALCGSWSGDFTRWRIGMLPSAVVLAMGIVSASWGVACASLPLALIGSFWCGADTAKARRWLGADLCLVGAATIGCGVTSWIVGSPGGWWTLAIASAGLMTGFLLLALSAPAQTATT